MNWSYNKIKIIIIISNSHTKRNKNLISRYLREAVRVEIREILKAL